MGLVPLGVIGFCFLFLRNFKLSEKEVVHRILGSSEAVSHALEPNWTFPPSFPFPH